MRLHTGLRKGAERQTIAAVTDIEAEFAVELLRDGRIRHRKMEMIHRMNAKLACSSRFLAHP